MNIIDNNFNSIHHILFLLFPLIIITIIIIIVLTVVLQERYCNLGWSLSSGDLNGDGFPDLVIGSPFAAGGGEQRGVVAVIYAKQNLKGSSPFTYIWNRDARGRLWYCGKKLIQTMSRACTLYKCAVNDV